MNAAQSKLRKNRARLAKYLELRSGVMSQLEAYYAAWPEEAHGPRADTPASVRAEGASGEGARLG